MRLHTIEAGHGDDVVVLLHGMMGSAESWHRVVPAVAAAGRRVVALDLPGHGLSPRNPTLTFDDAVAAVVDTVRSLTSGEHVTAVGHSYGGLLLAAAAGVLRPRLSIYIDNPFHVNGGLDRDAVAAQYERDRRVRTPEQLRVTRAHYSPEDAVIEGRAAERFDPATSASLSAGPGRSWDPAPGSIVLRADPSDYVTEVDARRLKELGVDVRNVPGAAHTVWYSHFDAFTEALPEIFAPTGPAGLRSPISSVRS